MPLIYYILVKRISKKRESDFMKNNVIKSNVSLLLAAAIWGLAFVAQSEGMDYIGPFTFGAARCFLGVLFLIPVWLIISRKTYKDVPRAEVRKIIGKTFKVGCLCGAVLFVAISSQQIGLVYTTAGKAGFITALYIVLVPVVSSFIFRRKAGIAVWISVALATVGLYLLCMPGGGFSVSKGDIYVLVCAAVFTGHILIVDRFADEVDGTLLSMVQFAVVALLSVPFIFITGETPSLEAISGAWVSICYTGILSCGVAYTLQIVGQKHANNPTVASLLMSMESVFAAVFGWLILNERLSAVEFIGALLMSGAIVLSQIKLPEKSK